MKARVVLVHEDPVLVQEATAALALAGHDVTGFTDTMAVLEALETAQMPALMIAGIKFPPGKPNGLALARMARYKRPGIKILFTALEEYREHTEDQGEFMPLPISIPDLLKTVLKLLEPRPPHHQ
jgi:DNA-binding NtrC family response regulator